MKKLTLGAMLTALAFALSFLERLIPLELLLPIPGVKLGLANTVSMFALLYLQLPAAFCILLGRCILSFFLFGSFTSFFFSITLGILSLLLMKLLIRFYPRRLSLPGLSMAGAAAHNCGQVLAAIVLLGRPEVIGYLAPLLVTAIPFGLITGYLGVQLFSRLEQAKVLPLK